ncbi:MAG TPA: hypothetical protein VF765_19285 [Polyangiaceae bacterium]
MRAIPALVTVAAIIAPLASVACYSVPDLEPSDGGVEAGRDVTGHNPDSSSGSGGSSGSTSGSGSNSGSGSGGSSGSGSGSSSGAASCDGGVLCACANAMDCGSGICATSSMVGNTLNGAVGNFCTRECCTSSDCPSGTVCFASGEGGQYCVDPTWLGRSKPNAPPTRQGGSSCGTGSQCNSGLCVSGACADTCCSYASSSCTSPNASCVFGAFPGKQGIDTHFAPHCAPLPGNTSLGNPCSNNSDCQGGLCYDFGGTIGSDCTQPCRTSPECGSDSVCSWDIQGSDVYAACFPLGSLSNFGATCSMDTQCGSGVCNSTNCTGPCFANGDCSAVAGWRCSPGIVLNFMTAGMYPVLSCGP